MNDDPRADPEQIPTPDHLGGTRPDPDNVISLAQFRARVDRGRRANRMTELLELPNPEAAIRALPGDELFTLLRENDPQSGIELLSYARPEQVQTVLDFGLWSGDRLSPVRMEEWVDVMAAMSAETVEEWMRGLDIELVALFIRKGARVYDLEIDPPPDEPIGAFYPTPDGLFVLDVVGYHPLAHDPDETPEEASARDGADPGTGGRALIQVIDNLYRADQTFARRVLVAVKAELDSELEEMAYRWRQGRMEDFGFLDATQALEVYRELDPTSVHIGEQRPGTRVRAVGLNDAPDFLRVPAVLGAGLDPASLFARAIDRITSADEARELGAALVALTNRVLAAARVSPADDQAVAAELVRMRSTLDLAVEFLARKDGGKDGALDEERAIDAVRTVAVGRLFRLGVSLAGKVRALGHALARRGPFAALDGIDLVEEPEATVLAAVDRARPSYPRVLDDPPANGERPFASLGDVARATLAIERAAAAQAMLLALGVRPAHLRREAREGTEPADPAALDTGTLARTALVLALGEPTAARATGEAAPPFRPLTSVEVARFAKAHPLPDSVHARARELLGRAVAAGPASLAAVGNEMAERWLETLSPLEPVLVRADPAGAPTPPRGGRRTPPRPGTDATPKKASKRTTPKASKLISKQISKISKPPGKPSNKTSRRKPAGRS